MNYMGCEAPVQGWSSASGRRDPGLITTRRHQSVFGLRTPTAMAAQGSGSSRSTGSGARPLERRPPASAAKASVSKPFNKNNFI